MKEAEIERKSEMLEAVGLTGMGTSSRGTQRGMRKRAGLARALVMVRNHPVRRAPPLADPLLARTINDLIVETQRKFGFTAVMVSHEIPEIFGISDYVAMLLDG